MVLRTACIQFAPEKAQTERNLDRIALHAKQAIEEGAQLIVFPETATSGYFLEGGVEQAALTALHLHALLSARLSPWPEGVRIVIGHYERGAAGEVFNSATLLMR
ncbi:MAG: beta-ureidopropionase, partial [Armatimonadota bacterium]